MKFIIDAQLPKTLADFLNYKGHDAIHTTDLPDKNFTKDFQIIEIAAKQQRIVVSKDGDFLESLLIKGEPEKLILVKTGNITNKELLKFFDNNLYIIQKMISRSNLIEINNENIIEHK